MIAIIPNVLDAAALAQLYGLIDGATFVDGKLTAGARAKRVKNNEMLKHDSTAATEVNKLIMAKLFGNNLFSRIALPKTARPIMINRYEPGMGYGAHVDNPMMGRQPAMRSDISLTLFLNEPRDYDGGELTILLDYGHSAIKLPAGHAVIYPSSSLHRVSPVTRGSRLVAVTWVQSLVRDPARRQVLFDIDRLRVKLEQLAPDAVEADLAFKTHANLLRMWAET
jgi:PKHD-type hydroxylase